MSWVNRHLQRQGDPGSCITSPGSDRSQWPAHSPWRASSSPEEQRWLSWMWNKCFTLPLQGPAKQRLRQCHLSRAVLLQQCKEHQTDLGCLFTLCSPREEHQEISNLTSAQSTATPKWETSCLGLFFSLVLRTIKDFWVTSSSTLLSSKWFFFSFHPACNSHFSLCLLPLSLQPWTLVQSLPHLLTGTGDAVKSPEASPSPG